MEPARLSLHCGAATLRLASSADDDVLVSLLPDDFDHDPTFARDPSHSLLEHRQAWFRHWLSCFRHPSSTDDWYLPFVVFTEDAPVGLQVLEGSGFRRHHEVDSSSFLIPPARGRGLGTAMRIAVLALAFDVLGAERAVTAARPDNVASHRVSQHVGYLPTGRENPIIAGSLRPIDTYALTRSQWATLEHPPVTIEGNLPAVATWDTTEPHRSDLSRATA